MFKVISRLIVAERSLLCCPCEYRAVLHPISFDHMLTTENELLRHNNAHMFYSAQSK